MSDFTTYGTTFSVPDRYTEGYALTANEATALNGLMAEMISHRIRSGPLDDLVKGQTPNDEQIAKANAMIAELATSFQFGAGRGPGAGPRVTDPVEREALAMAREKVRAAIAKKGFKLGKKGESVEGTYPFETYEQKVAEVAKTDSVMAAARKTVKARQSGGDDEIVLD